MSFRVDSVEGESSAFVVPLSEDGPRVAAVRRDEDIELIVVLCARRNGNGRGAGRSCQREVESKPVAFLHLDNRAEDPVRRAILDIEHQVAVRRGEYSVGGAYRPSRSDGRQFCAELHFLKQCLVPFPVRGQRCGVKGLGERNACSRFDREYFPIIRHIGLGASSRNAHVIGCEWLQAADGERIRLCVERYPLRFRVSAWFVLHPPSGLAGVGGPAYLNRGAGSHSRHLMEKRRFQAGGDITDTDIINMDICRIRRGGSRRYEVECELRIARSMTCERNLYLFSRSADVIKNIISCAIIIPSAQFNPVVSSIIRDEYNELESRLVSFCHGIAG